jgi:hypothetical protein
MHVLHRSTHAMSCRCLGMAASNVREGSGEETGLEQARATPLSSLGQVGE